MSTPSWKPDDINFLTPYLTVSDPDKSVDFYEAAFGFEPSKAIPGPDGSTFHAEMHYQGKIIVMFAPEGAWGNEAKTPANSKTQPGAAFYTYCEDVDALVAQAKDAGATVVQEPEDMFWGDRIANVLDPDGHVWTFATKVGEFNEEDPQPAQVA